MFENLLIVGSRTGEAYGSPPGDIRAFDVITGAQVWSFHTVPHPGEFGYEGWPKDAYKEVGGINVWGDMSLDEARGIIYAPTGSPTYDFYGADRIGTNLFGNCLLALDARTGKRLWHYQVVHHDLWDYDNTAPPQLITVRHNGKKVDAVAMAGKTGFLYVFNRVTGEPLWPIEERKVPADRRSGRTIVANAAVPHRRSALRPAVVHGRRHQSVSVGRCGTREVDRDGEDFRQQGIVHAAGDDQHDADPGQRGRRELGYDGCRSRGRHGLRLEQGRAHDAEAGTASRRTASGSRQDLPIKSGEACTDSDARPAMARSCEACLRRSRCWSASPNGWTARQSSGP